MTFPQVRHVLLASLVMTMASVAFADPLAGAPSTEISNKDAEKIVADVILGTRTVLLMVNFPAVGVFPNIKMVVISKPRPSAPFTDPTPNNLLGSVVFESAKDGTKTELYNPKYYEAKWPELKKKGVTSGLLAAIRDSDNTPYLIIAQPTLMQVYNLKKNDLVKFDWQASIYSRFFIKTILLSTSQAKTLYALSTKGSNILMTKGTFDDCNPLSKCDSMHSEETDRILCPGEKNKFGLIETDGTCAKPVTWKVTAGFINTDSVFLFDSASKSVYKFAHAALIDMDGQPIEYETIPLSKYFKYSETKPTTLSSTLSTGRANLKPVTKVAAKPATTDISIRTWIYVIVSLLSVAVFLVILIAIVGCVLCRKADKAKKQQQQGPNRGPTGGSSMGVKAGGSSIGAKADGSSMDVKSQLPGSKMTPKCGAKSSLGPHNIGAGQPKVGKQGSAQKVGKMKQGGHN